MQRILVVDDAAFMRTMLKNILVKNGFEIAGEASDGVSAILKYKEVKPDLVTLDITMPEMNGLETLKELRKFDSQAKVIMCSAMGQQAFVVEAIQSGAKDFIVKPFQEDRVIESIQKLFS